MTEKKTTETEGLRRIVTKRPNSSYQSTLADKGYMTFMMINEKIVDAEQAEVSAWDRGLYFGDGVYDVVQSYNGKLWAFEAHFERFKRSMHEIGIENVNIDEIKGRILSGFSEAKIPNALLYFHITRGAGPRAHLPNPLSEPQFLLFVKPAPDNEKLVSEGISAITYPEIRWKRCDIKSLNLLPNVLAVDEARKKGCNDAVFVEDDVIVEGTSSSFFAVKDEKVISRPLDSHVLPGITRTAIIGITRKLGVEFVEKEISLEYAYLADELFLSGTGYEIRGIVKLDGKTIGTGKPGKVTRKIIDFFIDYTRGGKSFEELGCLS